MKKVSLYIPCFNTARFIESCLGGVMKQTYPIDEVLIIDDGSRDDTVRIASKFNVRIIRHGSNKGLAAARNTAFREARNEFIASLDADCVAHSDWLEYLVNNLADGKIAGAGGLLCERYLQTIADRWRKEHMSQSWGRELMINPEFIYGSNTVLRRGVVCSVGLYNEALRNNYEDVDLSYKIYEAGYNLIYNPCAIVEHMRTDTISSAMASYWQWQYNRVFHKKKNIIRRLAFVVGNSPDLLESLVYKDLLKMNFSLLSLDFIFFVYQVLLAFRVKG